MSILACFAIKDCPFVIFSNLRISVDNAEGTMFYLFLFMIVTPERTIKNNDLSYVMRRSAFCENKGAVELHCHHAADQPICFCYIDIVQALFFLNQKFQNFIKYWNITMHFNFSNHPSSIEFTVS